MSQPPFPDNASATAIRFRGVRVPIWLAPVAIVALAVVVLGVVVVPRLTSGSIQGTWVGRGTQTLTDSSIGTPVTLNFGVLLSLSQTSSGQVSGSSQLCSQASGTPVRSAAVSITGSKASGNVYTTSWSGGDLTIPMRMTVSGSTLSFTSITTSGTITLQWTGTAHPGSQADYQAICSHLLS
jgi:hypothetical protein